MKLDSTLALLLSALAAAVALATAPARAGEIFVVNDGDGAGAGSIGAYSTSGATINASLISGLTNPFAIAAFDGNLLVGFENGTVGEYTTSGAVVNASLFSVPRHIFSMAVVGNDVFLVTLAGLSEYTAAGELVTVFRLPLQDPGGQLTGVAASGTDLFVTSQTSQFSVGEFTTSGATVNASLVEGLADPWVIAVAGGDLFVGNTAGPNNVGEYTTSGATVNASLVTGIGNPGAIAVSGGDLFVTGIESDVMSEYTTSGTLVNASLVTGLDVPGGILILPEPSTWVMFAIGAAALIFCGWRKRCSQA